MTEGRTEATIPAGRCETTYWASGEPCQARAEWHIQAGTRKFDGQDSCARHLALTCVAMLQGELNRELPVTRKASRAPPG
jgi:hypothetical protein